jgi:hypothetical protein
MEDRNEQRAKCDPRRDGWPSSDRIRLKSYLRTGGTDHVPSMIDGLLSLGQYMRSMRMNLPAGAGSQSAPGDLFWM